MPIKPDPDMIEHIDTSGLYATSESEDESDGDNDAFDDLGGFQVTRALPRYEEKKHTLRDLMQLLDTPNGIDLNPVYQREFVWREERQSGLIDSLFQGYYIPGLIFNKRVETIFGSIRREHLVCIDGQQRLTSVKRFTEGLVPCRDRHGRKWWFKESEGKSVRGRKYLPTAAKAVLWNKTFQCREYVGMSDGQEHDLFERVQRGLALTPAEKAQAQKGPWQDLARSFQKDYVRVANLSDNRRGACHDKIISSFVQIIKGREADSQEIRFRGTDSWVTRCFVAEASQHPCTAELKKRMRRTFDRFEELARENKHAFENDGLKPRATIAPVEFIAIAHLIGNYGDKKDNADLERAIREMRREVRRAHDDNVRRKPMVWATLMASVRASLGDCRSTKRAAPGDMEDEERHRRTRQEYGLAG